MKLEPGDAAPLIEFTDSRGNTVDLKKIVRGGDYVLLWFYPKAKSKGCSAQAKHYSDLHAEFAQRGVRVFGVSADPADDQCSFIDQLALEGAMVPDRAGTVGRAFGVGGFLGFGLMFGMYNRDTILINPAGKIEKIWRFVNPYTDAQTVLAYIDTLKPRVAV